MVIIFEGPDRVGKSTHIDNIKGYYNNKLFMMLHFSQIKSLLKDLESYKKYSEKLYEVGFLLMLENIKKFDFIYDRFHLGETVYSPLYRNYSGDYVFDLEKKYLKNENVLNEVFLITLIDDPRNLLRREDGISITDKNGIRKLSEEIELFKLAFDKSIIQNKLLINIDVFVNIEDISRMIIKFIEDRRI